MSSLESLKTKLTRRLLVPAVAVGAVASLGAYEFVKPASASAPMPQAAAAALDDNSVSALVALDHAMETLAARVTPAIVNVTVTSKRSADNGDAMEQNDNGTSDSDPFGQFFGQQFGPFGKRFKMQPQGPQVEHGLGSGVIISPDGYIVTNNHVIDGATDIRVTMTDKRILPAKLVGRDKLTDLAVLKVNATDLPSVPLGDSTKLRPGQSVLAFGNPLGFRFTVTRGIVSALNRPNPNSDRRAPGEFIQTDAAINPGNSGGPLVDAHGEVVGINTFLISETGGFSGMGFAIPTQIVKPTIEALIRDGKVEHAYIGVGINDVTPDEAKFFDVKKASGALISQVEPDSPGAKAGLKVGDVITGLNGKTVNDAGELQVAVGQKRPGTKVDLTVMRDGKSMQVPVTVEAMGARDKGTETSSAENGKPRWGLGLSDVTPELREQVNAPRDVTGALIQRVVPGSSADNAGLAQGEIITEVNRHPVRSAADVQRALASVPDGKDALVLVWSPNGGSAFRVLHPTQG
ncbi:MAG: Do family serine endopeptidase [Acidobacteria bacterium]|nr:Do family serine endopeptidase [Acidobacteriota bacterium]